MNAVPTSCDVRVIVRDGGKCTFTAQSSPATVGRWDGAKVGVFAAGPGHADFDWFRVTAPHR